MKTSNLKKEIENKELKKYVLEKYGSKDVNGKINWNWDKELQEIVDFVFEQALSSQREEFEKIINELPIDVQKDYKTKKVRILIDKKELKQKLGEMK